MVLHLLLSTTREKNREDERNEIVSVLVLLVFASHCSTLTLFVFVVVYIVVAVACNVNSYLESLSLPPLGIMKNGHT